MGWLALFCVSVAGGIVPVFALELYVVGAAAVLGPPAIVSLIVVTAAGQVIGKLVIYAAASHGNVAAKARGIRLERTNTAITRTGRFLPIVVFISALSSIPPFHLTTIACGLTRSGALSFATAGFAGRAARTGALVCLPHLVMRVFR